MTRLGYPVIGSLLCVLLASGADAAPSTQPVDVEKENAALKERVAALEARVKQLERQLRDRSATSPLPTIPAPAPYSLPDPFAIPTPAPESRRFPEMPGIQIRPDRQVAPREGWEQRDINGIRFYLVPLKEREHGR
jgi:hypothetical protein